MSVRCFMLDLSIAIRANLAQQCADAAQNLLRRKSNRRNLIPFALLTRIGSKRSFLVFKTRVALETPLFLWYSDDSQKAKVYLQVKSDYPITIISPKTISVAQLHKGSTWIRPMQINSFIIKSAVENFSNIPHIQ